MTSCREDDPAAPIENKIPATKDDVLHNLELSYNDRNLPEYDKLLDDNFVMIFSDADISAGVTPDQWARAKEVNVTSQMFDPNHPDPCLRVTSIDLSLDYTAEDWTIEPENESHPGESWWRKAVTYNLIMKWDNCGWERRGLGQLAEITIRWDPDLEHWRIVVWRDGVSVMLAMAPGDGAVENSSWGGIKALYQ